MQAGSLHRFERRLAAILAADVAGYSRLMELDEERTLARLKETRRDLVDPKIQEHRGRIVKTTGDGMLVAFASVIDAARCAVEVQRAMIDREAEFAVDLRIQFRIGINLGDIIVDENDIFGDGVNVAARLEALAEPGGICISGTVHDHVGGRLSYPFDGIGEQIVKNISRPVRAFALSAAAVGATPLVTIQTQTLSMRVGSRRGSLALAALLDALAGAATRIWSMWPIAAVRLAGDQAPTGPTASLAKPAPRLSVVVLPFTNLANDPQQEYFADALTDDLTTGLSRVANSHVISHRTASTYKGKSVNVTQIGRELGVRYVVEGSTRLLGDRILINVQMIDAQTGAHEWADSFDTDQTDLFKAERDISGRLAWTLHRELYTAVGRQIEVEKAAQLDARDLILLGWARSFRPESPAQLHDMKTTFQRALDLDPQSVDARVGIAWAMVESVTVGWSQSVQQDLEQSDQLLTEALERDRDHVRLRFALGLLRRLQVRFVESKLEFEKTAALDPNYAGALLQLGYSFCFLDQPEVALPFFERALELSISSRAQNIYFYYMGLGQGYLYVGRLDEAIDALKKAQAANSRVFFIPLALTAALALRGDIEEAKAALAELRELKPELRSVNDVRQGWAFKSPPYAALAARTFEDGLRRAGMPDE